MNANLVQSSSTTNQCLNYCSSGGVCLKSNDGPKCICLPKWTGERCDIPQRSTLIEQLRGSQTSTSEPRNDPCDSAPSGYCQNDGICYLNGNVYGCYCRYPYTGDYCEEISECYNYCLNGGICELQGAVPTCTSCMPGWTGTLCQKLITTTTSTTVAIPTTLSLACTRLPSGYCNSGTCIPVNDQAHCQCPPTHTGLRCETLVTAVTTVGPVIVTSSPSTLTTTTAERTTTCAEQPCQHGGRCYPNGNSVFCYCDSRYSGSRCEIPI